jgi:hypothetical protein
MSYLLFLALLLVSAIVYGAARFLGVHLKFKTIFKALAHTLAWRPIIVWSFMLLGGGIFFGIAVIATVILHFAGWLPSVQAMPIWSLLPPWGWMLLGTAVCYMAAMVYAWWSELKHSFLKRVS